MQDSKIKILSEAPIHEAVNKMAIPAIVGLLVMAIYNIVDTMFVSWLGTAATGATQVVMPIMMLSSSIGLAFGMGAGAVISRLLGQKNYKRANKIGSTTIFIGIFIGIVFTVLCLLNIEPILRFFGASPDVMQMAKDYGFYIIIGNMFIISNMIMNNMLRSEGSGKISMIGMLTGSILNMILDPIFIFVFNWGIEGAAIATTFSQTVTFIILLSSYFKNNTVIKIKLSYFEPKWNNFKEIMVVGFPTFSRQLLVSLAMALMNQNAGKYGGAELLAAIGIISRMTMLPLYVVFGLGQGLQPVVGFNQGAGNKTRVIGALKYSFKINIGFTMVMTIIYFLSAPTIMTIFKATTEVSEYGIKGFYFYSAAFILIAISNTISVFFQALGRGGESLFLSISRQGLFYIPLILILPGILGLDGILIAQTLADIITTTVSVLFLLIFKKRNTLDKLVITKDEEQNYA